MDIRISIEQPEPLIGTAATDGQEPLAFEGWLGLLEAVSALVDTSRRDPGDPDVQRAEAAGRREEKA